MKDPYPFSPPYTFDDYAEKARATAIYAGRDSIDGLHYATLGLVGEGGEIANQVKKIKRDDQGVMTDERRMKIVDELGDVLWYAQAIADELMIPGGLETIAQLNTQKLAKRADAGTIHGDRRTE
jgi:NTP pyrophosphatase (non-canonical NTP hydrolase)